ncbi:hypothetical protein [Klebsiella michiganensis]|uniref:hypothetical protein n=1 Tax=Klebsiella michiganensis TaxID=1134687 RepID=UPI0004D13697|nr:hypothetical protein [Klebsiella michiganensis]AIE68431.1 hypothetical protein HR38_08235 [Klebsiella michiganensis]ELT9741800.1 hypothetical protein [Klebsiella michiganensis]MBZ7764310.1 hypothetical protein [Klebsiella michiganensis]MCY0174663.1 hypothetical protein [Klebsiella michiganensis]MDS7810746.1 hypothetical protein [Klebsiella michiganensis]
MKKVSLSALVLAGSLLPVIAQASGSQDTWTRGWGQGVSEFVIKGKGQSQLSLTCEDYGSQPTTIIFTDASGHQVSMDGDKNLQLSIDDGVPIDISESESRVGGNNLAQAWAQLRNGKQVSVTGDGVKSATFTLAGAAKVLPAFGTHGCVGKDAL